MSLFYQHIVHLYSNGEYSKIKEELHNFEKTQNIKPFPVCIYRELSYAESNTYRTIRDEDIFPIRFLWLFELKEQVMMGVVMPLERSFYNPERLYETWLKIAADGDFRQELEKDDVLFDLENKAISMKRGWVLIGDTFIDDLIEIEGYYGEALMVIDEETETERPLFAHYKTKKKWHNGAIIAVRYETKRKPIKCPACSSHRIANILYGMPYFTDKLEKDMNSGRIILGGCCITNDDPKWQCADCQMVIHMSTGNNPKTVELTPKKTVVKRWGEKNPAKQVIRECVAEFVSGDKNKIFSPKDICQLILKKYPSFNKNTVSCQIMSDSINHTSRHHYRGGEDLYWWLEKGKYRLFDPAKDKKI